jgi:hypothetical protein
VKDLTPQALADLWYLKYGHSWVVRNTLTDEWKNIGRELMRNNLATYELLSHNQTPTIEIIKLKETCK